MISKALCLKDYSRFQNSNTCFLKIKIFSLFKELKFCRYFHDYVFPKKNISKETRGQLKFSYQMTDSLLAAAWYEEIIIII